MRAEEKTESLISVSMFPVKPYQGLVKAQGLPLLNGTNTENHLFQVQVLKLGPGFDFINVISYIEFSLYGAIYCIP